MEGAESTGFLLINFNLVLFTLSVCRVVVAKTDKPLIQSQQHHGNTKMTMMATSKRMVDQRSEQGDVGKTLDVSAFDAA